MTLASNPLVPLLVPIVTAIVGAVGLLIREQYDRRTEMGRRKYAMEEASRRVTFAAEWWKAKQALGSTPDDEAARSFAESWLEEATSLVSKALHPPRRPEPNRPVTRRRRILLAYPLRHRSARVLRVVYYILLAFTAFGLLSVPLTIYQLAAVGDKTATLAYSASIVVSLGFYGLLALGVRAWAVWIENRAAKQRFVSTSSQQATPVGSAGNPRD